MSRRCTFKGQEYVAVFGSSKTEFALATQDQYENFEISYAYGNLKDNSVKRFGVKIGTCDEVKFLEDEAGKENQ